MFLVYLAVLQGVRCVDVEVFGDVAFDVRLPKEQWYRGSGGDDEANQLVFSMVKVRRNVTAAPVMECVYQYPERNQVDSMLSNMMNELTKIFVRATDFINGVDMRRDVMDRNDLHRPRSHRPRSHRPHPRHPRPHRPYQRRLGNDTRFQVVDKKQKGFFDVIYTNMTLEYIKFYNSTEERVDRAGRDPCQHQDEIKQIWRDLLENSLQMLQRAARRCADEYLLYQNVEPHSRNAVRLGQYLERELSKVRTNQLAMLCDTYQLCYNDLLI